ncbi:MAG: undecaprenyldiphospho-muramoylpentapeptide beta-N-acetylglucosaminyltransferase [Clostridia bacterium]|nr:undecaprenyldiphospho-muramoylpentapeptide beta-N-acetylglucosaminyltransferase [Clostridia bacterium]
MRILFATGGTGGHINPAIAIAKEFRKNHPQCEILFVGTKRGLEGKLVPREGFDINFIETVGFKRKITLENIVVAYKAFTSMLHTRKILKEFSPDIVIGCGGYTSGPVVMEAALKKIPTLIHEQNAFPGISNKMLSGKVNTVCISFEDTVKYFPKAKKVVYTGNPVRPSMFSYTKEEARQKLGLDSRPLFVSVGGSLGAGRINAEMKKLIKKLPSDIQIMWATGNREYEEIISEIGEIPSNVTISPYIYNMEEVLSAADLVLSRSGAITLTELCACGTPSVLIPSPNVAENHQEINARTLEEKGASVVICERELDENILFDTVIRLIYDTNRLNKMSEKAKQMAKPDATSLIYTECISLLGNKS